MTELTAMRAPSDAALERRVLDRLDAEAIAGLAAQLICAGSENPGGTEEATVAVLRAALSAFGARVETQAVAPGRPNLIARVGDDRPGVLFLGHSDVVPAGDGWTGDPFTPRRDGDRLIGRGATDMKGGLAAVVAAMAAVLAEDPTLPMTLLCTVDEEADAIGVRHHVAATAPDAGYAGCVVAEPTGMVTITGCRGAANLRVDVDGASAHAGRPSDGANAILAAADVIAAVEEDARELEGRRHPVLGAATWSVGTIAGGHGTSIVPDRCTLTLDRRTLPGEDPTRILDDLLGRAARISASHARPGAERITVRGTVEMVMPGFVADPASSFVTTIRDAVRAAGGAGDTDVWTASCEGGFIAAHHGTPTVVLGPGDLPGQAHQPDESVSVSELLTAARAYALIALRMFHPTTGQDPHDTIWSTPS